MWASHISLKLKQNEKALPAISPREHRLMIQSPSLIRNRVRKEDMQTYRDAIERSLSRARANTFELKDLSRDLSAQRIKYALNKRKSKKNIEKLSKITTFKVFNPKKPLKSPPTKKFKCEPISTNRLMIVNHPPKRSALTNRASEVPNVSLISNESDEDKMEYQIESSFIHIYT